MAPSFKSGRNIPLARLLQPGKLIEVDTLAMSLGGAVPNTGLAMHYFGNKMVLNGLAGQDQLGELVISILKKHGLESGVQRIRSTPTAYSIVLAPKGSDRVFLESPGCNQVFSTSHVDYMAAAQSRLFHFGYPPLMERIILNQGQELARIFKQVKKAGTVTSLDMSMPDPNSKAGKARWQAILARVLPSVDILIPSIEEMLFMLAPGRYAKLNKSGDIIKAVPEDLYRTLSKKLVNMGPQVVVLKAGHKGIYIRTGKIKPVTGLKLASENWSDREVWIPCFRAKTSKIKNASGAGDTAIGAFLTAVLKGTTIEMAGRYAALAGRDNLYGSDALSGLTDWEKMTKVLKVKNRKAIVSPGLKQFVFTPQTYVYNAR
jgi:sugar/nucleoside kinase (ribokinase family)